MESFVNAAAAGLGGDDWRTPSFSLGHGECFEITRRDRDVYVRDSKDRTGPVFRVPSGEWQEFTDAVKRLPTPSKTAEIPH
jgi:hypothetical protein